MKVGILLPIAETDSGTILRTAISATRHSRPSAIGSTQSGCRSSPLPVEWSSDAVSEEGWTLLSALAKATTHIELGAWLCARRSATRHSLPSGGCVDEVSEGRLTLGLGAGWHEPEFSAFGYPFDHLASRFEDALRHRAVGWWQRR